MGCFRKYLDLEVGVIVSAGCEDAKLGEDDVAEVADVDDDVDLEEEEEFAR